MLLLANLLQCLDIFAAQKLDIGIVFIPSNYTILVTKNELCTFFIEKKGICFLSITQRMSCIPQKLLKDMVYMYNSCFSSVLYASMLHFGRVRLFYYCKYTKIVGIIYLDKTSNTKKRAFYGSFRSLKSAFSRHDNVRASSTLFIWLNENVDINIAPLFFLSR